MLKDIDGISKLTVPFKSLRNFMKCTICNAVVLAILGLNGIPENKDSVSLETIEYSSVIILAREGHATVATVYDNFNPLFDLELFAKRGESPSAPHVLD